VPSGNPKLSRSSSASAQSAQQIKFLLGQATTLLKSGQARAAEGYFRQLLVASPAHPQVRILVIVTDRSGDRDRFAAV
jgi:hypothetical protein